MWRMPFCLLRSSLPSCVSSKLWKKDGSWKTNIVCFLSYCPPQKMALRFVEKGGRHLQSDNASQLSSTIVDEISATHKKEPNVSRRLLPPNTAGRRSVWPLHTVCDTAPEMDSLREPISKTLTVISRLKVTYRPSSNTSELVSEDSFQ